MTTTIKNQGINLAGGINDIHDNIFQYAERLTSLHQLPDRNPNFVGRVNDQTTIRSLLDQSQNGGGVAISAVAGMGGVGKSALALHLAHELMGKYSDVQLYVNLRGADENDLTVSAESVLTGWLMGFGYDQQQVEAWNPDQKASAYRSAMAGKKAIVLLDNARDAKQVKPLLPGSSSCVVLVTSRRSLVMVRGLVEHRLGVMNETDAIALFTTIWRSQVGSCDLGDRTGLCEVVKLCGYLPLGIEIVAATALERKWDVGRTIEKLQQVRLDVMQRDDDAADVRACFELSYRELPEDLGRVFIQLSGVPGLDFGFSVVEYALGREEVRDELEQLEATRLLESKGVGRFEMHDLVREFALEKLSRYEATNIGMKAAQWYVGVADFQDDCIRGDMKGDRLTEWLESGETEKVGANRLSGKAIAWFHAEYQNLLALVGWAFNAEEWPLVIRLPKLLATFAGFQTGRGELLEAYDWSLKAAKGVGDRLGEANTLKAIADVLQFKKRSEEALENYNQAIVIYREVGARLGEANTLQAIGILLSKKGNYRQAVPLVEEALAIYRNIDDRYNQGITLQNLGFLYQQTGRVQEGFSCSQEATAILTELGLLSYLFPNWIKAIIDFAKRKRIYLVLCVISGIFAFPFAVIGLIGLLIWRLIVGRFRR